VRNSCQLDCSRSPWDWALLRRRTSFVKIAPRRSRLSIGCPLEAVNMSGFRYHRWTEERMSGKATLGAAAASGMPMGCSRWSHRHDGYVFTEDTGGSRPPKRPADGKGSRLMDKTVTFQPSSVSHQPCRRGRASQCLSLFRSRVLSRAGTASHRERWLGRVFVARCVCCISCRTESNDP